ncbi:MAG: hypothetical protein IPK21_04125 [Haliscomenobacter sp.]|nr:hypothetical protein [Haliscomenobacter sp.]
MKSHKAFLPVLVSLILLSCERESFVNNEAINEFRKEVSLMSGDERIESFRKLSASQKSKLWKSKFDQILSTEINSGQKEAILELKGEIEDIFYFSESVNSNITSNKNYWVGLKIMAIGFQRRRVEKYLEICPILSRIFTGKTRIVLCSHFGILF